MIYLFCFTISCLLIWFGENNRKYFLTSKILFLLALVIPAALAGLRDFSIGKDTLFYCVPFFNDVVGSPSLDTVALMWDDWLEPGYKWLNFIVAQFTDDVHWLFFIIILLQNIFTFLGFYYYKDKIPIWLGMLYYYFVFFNPSLNAIRESLAMSILFSTSRYLLNKSYMKYTICILITCLFHKSAISAFLFIPLHFYITKFESNRAKIILVFAMTILFLNLETTLQMASNFLQMPYLSKALWYLTSESKYNLDYKTIIVNTALFAPPFLFFYWKRNALYKLGKEYNFFFIITVLCLLSTQLMFLGDFASRFSSSFRWVLMLILPMSLAIYNDLKGKQFLLKAYIFCYIFGFWFITVINRNVDETFPYYSPILNSIF